MDASAKASAALSAYSATRTPPKHRLGFAWLLSLGFLAGMISHFFFQSIGAVDYASSNTIITAKGSGPVWNHQNATQDDGNHGHFFNVSALTPVDWFGIQPRTWEPYPASQPLCFKPQKIRFVKGNDFPVWSAAFDRSFMTNRGIVFLKPMKVGGSSASGINLRLAKNMAERLGKDYAYCDNNFDHAMGYMMVRRKRTESFLWTLLRDPTNRAISGYYHFDVSRFGSDATLENFIAVMANQTDYYLRLHSFNQFPSKGDLRQKSKAANHIMKNYDFMAITERFDESMVVLHMLLKAHNVTLGDMLYVKAKSNGGYDDGGHNGRCTFIQKPNITPDMKQYMTTESWKKVVEWDYALYAAANRSLDMTIDLLGREAIERKVELYRWAQSLVKERCAAKALLPCTTDGIKRLPSETNCLFADSGCAYKCLDAIVAEHLMPGL